MAAARGHRQPPFLQAKSEGSSQAAAQHSPLLTAYTGTGAATAHASSPPQPSPGNANTPIPFASS